MSGPAPVLRVLWLLARPAPGNRAVLVLPVMAFALVSALLFVVLAGALSFLAPGTVQDAQLQPLYRLLALFALALLVTPLLTLAGAAARLAARRRDERLSTLRLLGATPAFVAVLTVAEATALAAAGVLLGAVLYAAVLPAVALIPFQGRPLGLTVLWLAPGVLLAAIAAVIALAAVSASIALRKVIVSPLGVRTRQRAGGSHWGRLAGGAAAVLVLYGLMTLLTASGSLAAITVIAVGGFAAGLAVLNLMGPFVLRCSAARALRRATTPVRLLAARTVLEAPKAAWRQVSALSMTSFIAVVAGTSLAIIADAGENAAAADLILYADLRTGVLITVVASFLLVACSAGVNQAAAVLDRGALYRSLDRLGMPRRVMERARRRAVLAPVVTVTVGSAVVAGTLLFPLTGLAVLVAPLSLLVIAGVLAGGIALVWLALLATAPVLGSVLREA